MDNLIKIYDNVVSAKVCDEIVDKFNLHPEHQQIYEKTGVSFRRIDMVQHKRVWGVDMASLMNDMFDCVSKYKEEINPAWPESMSFESFRIKRYGQDVDQFSQHVDCTNLQNCRRFLVFFLYLTNNDKGATVVEPIGGEPVISPCKKGSVLVFPPFWNFPHRGEMPVKTPKYIVGSYLHYANRPDHQRYLRDAN